MVRSQYHRITVNIKSHKIFVLCDKKGMSISKDFSTEVRKRAYYIFVAFLDQKHSNAMFPISFVLLFLV